MEFLVGQQVITGWNSLITVTADCGLQEFKCTFNSITETIWEQVTTIHDSSWAENPNVPMTKSKWEYRKQNNFFKFPGKAVLQHMVEYMTMYLTMFVRRYCIN